MADWKNRADGTAEKAKLDSILQPDTKAKIFTITVEFGRKISANYEKAVELARRNPSYTESGEGDWIRHAASYTPEDVEELFELFNLVHEWDSTEVLVNHKRLPYGHQLWLPLMWFYRIKK